MITRICTLLMLISACFSYGQNITLLKNFNPKVKELKHELNHNRDSLKLQCESKIVKVDIFNEDHEQTIEVKDFSSLISLHKIPEGKFVVEVQLEDKIVEMHIIKQNSDVVKDNLESVEGYGMMLDEDLNVIKSAPKNSIEYLLTRTKSNKTKRKKKNLFWVVLEVNNGNNSYKSQKLVDKNTVTKMIARNKLSNKTIQGKSNKLSVWEVYESAEFMKKQTADPNFINTSSSDIFNVIPYYITSKNDVIASTKVIEPLKK